MSTQNEKGSAEPTKTANPQPSQTSCCGAPAQGSASSCCGPMPEAAKPAAEKTEAKESGCSCGCGGQSNQWYSCCG